MPKKPVTDCQPGSSLTITPKVDVAALQAMQHAAEVELEAQRELVITDNETAEVIAQCLTEELGKLDQIEEMRKDATGPLNQLKRTIDGWFAPGKEKSSALILLFKNALGVWHRVQQLQKEQSLALAGSAMRSGDVAQLTQALTAVNQQTVKPTGVSFVDGWTARVVNLKMLVDYATTSGRYDLVKADDKRLAELAKGSAQPQPVPGVLFEQTTGVRGSHG